MLFSLNDCNDMGGSLLREATGILDELRVSGLSKAEAPPEIGRSFGIASLMERSSSEDLLAMSGTSWKESKCFVALLPRLEFAKLAVAALAAL